MLYALITPSRLSLPVRPHLQAGHWLLLAIASCSSTGSLAQPSIVGEWRAVSGGGPQGMFFDADGTFGQWWDSPDGGLAMCVTGTYRFEGGSLYRTQFQTDVSNVPATLGYDTLTLQGFEGSPNLVYRRENSLPVNQCP